MRYFFKNLKIGLLLIATLIFIDREGFSQQRELNDPQILSVIHTINHIELEYCQIAVDKSHSEEVREFARTMVTKHKALNQQTDNLEKELIVVPQTNSITRDMTQKAKLQTESLHLHQDAHFDKAYLDNEIAFRSAAVLVIKNTLMHQVKNERIRAFLQEIYPLADRELKMAIQLRKKTYR